MTVFTVIGGDTSGMETELPVVCLSEDEVFNALPDAIVLPFLLNSAAIRAFSLASSSFFMAATLSFTNIAILQ
jgi:hypothetical protein